MFLNLFILVGVAILFAYNRYIKRQEKRQEKRQVVALAQVLQDIKASEKAEADRKYQEMIDKWHKEHPGKELGVITTAQIASGSITSAHLGIQTINEIREASPKFNQIQGCAHIIHQDEVELPDDIPNDPETNNEEAGNCP